MATYPANTLQLHGWWSVWQTLRPHGIGKQVREEGLEFKVPSVVLSNDMNVVMDA